MDPPGRPPSPPGAVVDVWWLDLDATPAEVATWEGLLAPDEAARAARLRSRRDRDRFVAARAQLRVLLGTLLDRAPAEVRFAYGPAGKPSVPGVSLQFNLAHSGGTGLVAVADGRRVGADVERVRPDPLADGVAERFFTAAEAEGLRAVDEVERAAAFFRCWTRKEAFVKANGLSVAPSLARFEVSFRRDERPAVVWCAPGLGPAADWAVLDVSRAPEEAAAVVVEGAAATAVVHG
jgi:4'-phosphopantetheinyl transferase